MTGSRFTDTVQPTMSTNHAATSCARAPWDPSAAAMRGNRIWSRAAGTTRHENDAGAAILMGCISPPPSDGAPGPPDGLGHDDSLKGFALAGGL